MQSAVTVSLVEEARGGPFVFWNDLPTAFGSAKRLGFDAIEIFAPGPDTMLVEQIRSLCDQHELPVAAVGTGAGMVKHGLSLTDADPARRRAARDFVASIIQFGANFNAPAIIGSMQGRWNDSLPRDRALEYLVDALAELGNLAAEHSNKLLYEPLNRYETNLINCLEDGCRLIDRVGRPNVRLLADLFHMNIEEADMAVSLKKAGNYVGHVHFVDSNRQAAGLGHLCFEPIISALRQGGYTGYLSAEAFAKPDSEVAAQTTINSFRKLTK
jgi:sugar phosphate isomerase/epimerase